MTHRTDKAKPETVADLMPQTPNLRSERLDALRKLFPDLFDGEGQLQEEELRALADPAYHPAAERYEFPWTGKTRSKRDAFTPSRTALVYDEQRSVNPDKACGNVIIEGENLEVLKLLTAAYRERVKVIYIDPPYNTGKDFVYSDDYTEGRKPYWEESGVTERGVKVDTNSDSEGRYHSNWLSMMHARLLVARYLLKPDGVIMVSIDDHEYQNLQRLMGEVFGHENYVATLVWEKGRKNDARFFSVGHEYMLVYARDFLVLRESGVVWRQPIQGATEIWEEYKQLRTRIGDDDRAIEAALSEWFTKLPEKHPSRKLSRYRRIDKWGPWRDRDISWPGGGGPRYDVPHPRTKQPCKVPEDGWRFADPREMQRQIDLGLVQFREDHTEPPFRKAHLRPIVEELAVDAADVSGDDDAGAEQEELATQVRGSYFYAQSQAVVRRLKTLMGGKIFQNPKDDAELARLFAYVCGPGNGSPPQDLILDFFGGSGTTAQAVMDLNAADGGNRRFLLVQLPELTKEHSLAFKEGYKKISDITIERNKRLIVRYRKEADGLFPTDPKRQYAESLGFKVYTLEKSNFPRVDFAPNPDKSEAENVELLKAYIREKESTFVRTWDRQRILDEVLMKNGFMFDRTIVPAPEFTKNRVEFVKDTHRTALVCLDESIAPETVDALEGDQEQTFICLEAALDTTKKWNLKHHLGDRLRAI